MIRALTITAAAGSALVAGVLFAFSTFVMAGLRRLPDDRGAAAMQAINKEAPTSPAFLAAFVGTALVSVGLAISALARLDEPSAPYQLAGSVLYLACIALTRGFHIPRNNALDRVDPETAAGVETWRNYVPGWTAWNHVRVATALAGSELFVLSLSAT